MNEVLRSILSSKSVITEDGIACPLHSNISEEEGNFIQEMIGKTRPQVSLEVGCAYGISSLYICDALRGTNAAKHIIIDPGQHFSWQGIGLSNLRRAGYADIIDFHEARSYECLPRLIEERVNIDFAFIDGAHTFDYVLVDVFLIDKLLRPGGIVILDDFSYPSIRSVCRYVLSNLSYRCVGPASSRVALWQKLAWRLRRDGITGLVSAPLRRIVPQLSPSDRQLNLPSNVNYVALQKLENDLLDEGYGSTRHWTYHRRF